MLTGFGLPVFILFSAMSEQAPKSPPLLPFVIADVLFVGMAGAILVFAHRPLLWWEALLMVACGAAAAWSLTAPILRQDANQQAHAQNASFAAAAAELQKLENLAAHIQSATGQWKSFETHAAASLEAARGLTESFSAETRGFAEILQKSNDGEKARLRLEVEKLRRMEGEWLQTLTRVLDHVFALFQAAQRTGQRSLIDQISLFQESCREAARRVGLAPLMPRLGEAFDPRAHQVFDNTEPPEQAVVADIVATGFTFQGQLLRRAFVAVQAPAAAPAAGAAPAESQQNDLPLPEEAQP